MRRAEASEPLDIFLRALEISEKDGSIVLEAGSTYVTFEEVTIWDVIKNDAHRAARVAGSIGVHEQPH